LRTEKAQGEAVLLAGQDHEAARGEAGVADVWRRR
jgi:hypothetical protein